MKVGEIHVQTRTVGELRYSAENMVVIHRVTDEKVYFSRIKLLPYCNNSGELAIADFNHLFEFYF